MQLLLNKLIIRRVLSEFKQRLHKKKEPSTALDASLRRPATRSIIVVREHLVHPVGSTPAVGG
jgi:hypothetical protein